MVPDRKSDLSELSEPSDDDENPNPWIQVVPRRAHSLDSLSKDEKNKQFIALPNGHGINDTFRTQKRTMLNRSDKLPDAQNEQNSCRYERRIENNSKLHERLGPLASRPSDHKEKGVDPRNLSAAQ